MNRLDQNSDWMGHERPNAELEARLGRQLPVAPPAGLADRIFAQTAPMLAPQRQTQWRIGRWAAACGSLAAAAALIIGVSLYLRVNPSTQSPANPQQALLTLAMDSLEDHEAMGNGLDERIDELMLATDEIQNVSTQEPEAQDLWSEESVTN